MMRNVGSPVRNTCTHFHSEMMVACTRAGMEDAETVVGMEERKTGGCFPERVRLVI